MAADSVPVGWRQSSLSEHCMLLNGLAFKPEDWTQFGLPIIRIQNLNGSTEFNRCNRRVGDAHVIKPGTLLFSWSGNRGTSFGPYRWPGPTGILNQHIFKVTPRDGTDAGWFFYALDVVREKVERAAHGGLGLVHVRRGDLLAYAVPTPPLPEQRRIAEILDTLDEAIRKTEQVIAKLQQMKQGLLHDLLTRGIDEHGELRDPERHPEQFKDSPLGRIPRGWEVGPLGTWLGCAPKNGYSPRPVDEWTGTVMLGLGCLTTDGFEARQIKNAPRTDGALQKYLLRPGDLLVSRSNTRELVGLAGVYEDVAAPCIYPDLMMRLSPVSSTSPRFLEQVLRSPEVRRQIQAAASGTSGSMVKISGPIVRNLRVAMPDFHEQAAVVDALQRHVTRITLENADLHKLRILKHGLMDDLLTGRVRVTNSEAS